jgi:VWFA-related protein
MTEIEALVADAAGRIAPDLTAADFSLESGKPMKIASCTYVDTRARRTMVFLVDDLRLTAEAIDDVRAGLDKFVETAMQPDDRVAILRSGAGEGELQQLTGGKEALHQAIARLYYNPRRGFYTSGAARANAFNTGAMGTLRVAMAGLRRLPGRKAVVLFSLGLNEQPVTDLETLVADARRAEVSVYGIDPSAAVAVPVERPGPSTTATPVAFTDFALTQLAETGMAGMAKRTAGELLASGAALPDVLARAMSAPNGYYRIGYLEPDAWAASPRLKVVRPGMQLLSTRQASESSSDPQLAAPRQREDDLPRALLEPFTTGQIRTRITPLFYNSAQGSTVEVMVHFDVRDLTFRQGLDGTYHGAAEILVAAFGSTGQSLEHRAQRIDLGWNESQYQQGLRAGIVLMANLPVRSPMLQIRAVVCDDASGRMGSASQWLEVPAVEDGRLAISGIELTGPEDSATGDRFNLKEPDETPGVRIFRGSQPINYRCQVYNLTADAGKASRIDLQIVLFREGHMAISTQPLAIALRAGGDPRRRTTTGHITLPASMEPGRYAMRLSVTDKLASAGPPRTASQFVEFELRP